MERDGYPWWPFWENVRSWWEVRHLPNVLLVHFANLKADMAAEIRRIAAFLEIPINEQVWPRILEHCSFDYMKAHAADIAPRGGAYWDEGPEVFLPRGVNGRWEERLPELDRRRYEERALAELGPECARWMTSGEMPS
jgi:aryl sulfotransferase